MALRSPKRLTQHRGHRIKTEPASEPVTAAAFKAHIVDDGITDEEALAWVAGARKLIEDVTGLALITQVWDLTLDRWPAHSEPWWDGVRQGAISELQGQPAGLELPLYPLQSVDAVYTYSADGTETAITVADVFDVDTYSRPARLALKSGQTWPVALRPTNAIKIEYSVGYGLAVDVPAPLALAVKQVAAYLYAHRGDECTADDALAAAGGLLSTYKAARL